LIIKKIDYEFRLSLVLDVEIQYHTVRRKFENKKMLSIKIKEILECFEMHLRDIKMIFSKNKHEYFKNFFFKNF
jgi:hypothetical protein